MRDDEPTIDAEVTDTLGNVVGTREEQGSSSDRLDRAPGSRSPRPSFLKAKTAVALDRGARSMTAAIIEAGGAPATAHNWGRNGFTFERVYADKDALFPNAPTNRTINDLAKRELHKRLQNNPSEPLLLGAYQRSGEAAREDGDEDQQLTVIERINASRFLRRRGKGGFRRGIRYAARLLRQLGAEQALEVLQDIEQRSRTQSLDPIPLVPPKSSWTPTGSRS